MNSSSFIKADTGDLRGWLRKDLSSFFTPSFFENPASFLREKGGETIKESKLRWAAIFSLSSGERVFVKRDRTKGFFESAKFLLLPSKARKEWSIAASLHKKGLPVPQPLGWMERRHRGLVKESFYFSAAIGAGVSVIDDPVTLKDRSLLQELAETLKKFHDAGLFHKDLHAGNFIFDKACFFLVDLHRAEIIRQLSLKQRLWSLSHLFHSLRFRWEEEDEMRFIDDYFGKPSLSSAEKGAFLDDIHVSMERLQRRQWRSRTKRCLKESTDFSVRIEKGVSTYCRKKFPADRLEKALAKHLFLVREQPAMLLKKAPEVAVSSFEEGADRFCVKQFCYPSLRDRVKESFRTSKGLRAWVSGNGLKVRNIAAPLTFALVEKRNGWRFRESFLVMEALDAGREMDRILSKGFKSWSEKRQFIETFARWFSSLHRKEVYHRDMKTCNLLISERGETWDFCLLDLEDVRLDEKVGKKKAFKNFLQMNSSTPRNITRTDRLRFLKAYLSSSPEIEMDRSSIRKLIEESRKRGLVYISHDGLLKEEMT